MLPIVKENILPSISQLNISLNLEVIMDIFSFIPSPDISAYCKNIGHKFNPLEMAVIVAMSSKAMKEKHAAWRKIIAEHPDMKIHQSLNFNARESLHTYLRELIEHEEKQIAAFYSSSNNVVFRYSIFWTEANGWNEDNCVFSSINKVWLACRKEYKKFAAEILQIKVEKSQIDSTDYAHKAYMNLDGELL